MPQGMAFLRVGTDFSDVLAQDIARWFVLA